MFVIWLFLLVLVLGFMISVFTDDQNVLPLKSSFEKIKFKLPKLPKLPKIDSFKPKQPVNNIVKTKQISSKPVEFPRCEGTEFDTKQLFAGCMSLYLESKETEPFKCSGLYVIPIFPTQEECEIHHTCKLNNYTTANGHVSAFVPKTIDSTTKYESQNYLICDKIMPPLPPRQSNSSRETLTEKRKRLWNLEESIWPQSSVTTGSVPFANSEFAKYTP